MEILQGSINRDQYYSVKECSEILDVTTRTVRNRIEAKKIRAVWYEIGPGQSQWLIPKEDVRAMEEKEVGSASHQLSIPLALMNEIKAQIRAENETIRAENAQFRADIQEVKESQVRIEKSLLERDAKLLQAIRERQEERNKNVWWKFWE